MIDYKKIDKSVIIVLIIVLVLITILSRERTGAVCRDGAESFATGSRACSFHGGVSHWKHKYWWNRISWHEISWHKFVPYSGLWKSINELMDDTVQHSHPAPQRKASAPSRSLPPSIRDVPKRLDPYAEEEYIEEEYIEEDNYNDLRYQSYIDSIAKAHSYN